MDISTALIIGLVCAPWLYFISRCLKRRKKATQAAMRCLGMSEHPTVRASRNVH